MDFDFAPIDADNHYYEPLDAFTRHLDPKYKQRGVQVVNDGRHTHLADRRTRQPVRPEPDVRPDHRARLPRPDVPRPDPRRRRPADADAGRAARDPSTRTATRASAVAERQGLGAVFLFPTLGCGVEEALKHDVPATMASLAAFNRWLEEDWGFAYEHRLVTAPMLSLADPDAALEELDRLIERGARIVHIRPAPVPGEHGTSRSLGDRLHDPVWARLAEASIPVAFHLGDSGYNAFTVDVGRVARTSRASARRTSSAGSSSPTAPSTTRSRRSSSTACSPGTRRCASRASRTAPTGWRCS